MRLEFLLTINRGEDTPDIELDILGEYTPEDMGSAFTPPMPAEFLVIESTVHDTGESFDLTEEDQKLALAEATKFYNEGLKFERES